MENKVRMMGAIIGHCKKHPKHKQSPGVCSVCLNDRLSKIPSRSLRKYNKVSNSSCSSSNLSSISSISSESSPAHDYDRGRFSIGNKSMSTFLRKDRGKSTVVLTKSTSMAFVLDHRKQDGLGTHVIIGTTLDHDHAGSKKMIKDKKKSGFWSKILRPRTSKSIDRGLIRSMSMSERVIASSMVH